MDSQESPKPSWWLLSLVTVLLMGLLIGAHRLILLPGWRGVADLGIVCFNYGLMEFWLRKNTSAPTGDQPDEAKTTIIVVEPLLLIDQDPLQITAASDPHMVPSTTSISSGEQE